MKHLTIALTGLLCASAVLARPAAARGLPDATPFNIAITVDDLPAHGPVPAGTTRASIIADHVRIMKAHGVPEAYGFVNGKLVDRSAENAAALDVWRKGGFPLGNHTYSHMNLNQAASLEAWQADVIAGEPAVASRMQGADWRWLRFPNVAAGKDATQQAAARAWLTQRGYRIAEVTMSFTDWAYAEPYGRCMARNDQEGLHALKADYLRHVDSVIAYAKASSRQVFGRVVPQVLLTHVAAFSAVMLPEVLDRLEQAGARYVTLAQAQSDPAYAQPGGGYVIERAAVRQRIHLPANRERGIDLDALCR
ncbi:polysaccharide deacetylase family protein [Massilia sp. YMA4]|uniref:polysaccharide deacetylase family protein n=1 Tax=Massilia sp. YMA4 TaxID=1593482 RepID=UPI000DD15614|nr:polysaccharide deacetylase family protein [Massilia sp. YMA4]AXA92121.1 polysaccharide deacetylase [Massilia sp. YMA4]